MWSSAGSPPSSTTSPFLPLSTSTSHRHEISRTSSGWRKPYVLEAGLLTADEPGTWFPRHPVESWSHYDTLHLMTRYGPVDLVFAPDGAPRGHLTVPEGYRPRRRGGEIYVAPPETLRAAQVRRFEGIPTVVPETAIDQAIRAGVSTHLLRQAIETARARGLVTEREHADLERRLGEHRRAITR